MTWSKHLEEYQHMGKEEEKKKKETMNRERGEPQQQQLATETKIFLTFIWPILLHSSKHPLLKEKHIWLLLPKSLYNLKWDMSSQHSCRKATQHKKAPVFGQNKSAKGSWTASRPPHLLLMKHYGCKLCQLQMSTPWHLQ